MKNTLLSFLRQNKLFLIGVVIGLLVLLFLELTRPQNRQTTLTQPETPIVTPPSTELPLPPALEQQTFSFNWNSVDLNLPAKTKSFIISQPLISKNTISLLSQSLGFSDKDLLAGDPTTNKTWQNDQASLFGSVTQNQIIYRRSALASQKSSTVTSAEAIDITKTVISNFFGDSFLSTLDPNPQVRFLALSNNSYGPTPVSDPAQAEYIEVAYKQTLDSYPLTSLGGNTNIISITIDNQRKLYRFEVYGGYLTVTSDGEYSLANADTIKSLATSKALKISSLTDVSLEAAHLYATELNVDVSHAFFGYFQNSDNLILPVVFVIGTVSSSDLPDQTAIYALPASAN